MRFPRIVSAAVVLLSFWFWFGMAKPARAKRNPAAPRALPPLIFVVAPTVVPGGLAGRFPRGSHLALLSPAAPAKAPADLTPLFFAAADPAVSFDASHVLFSGQKTRGGRWQIWEMSVDGGGQRQLTNCPGNCFRPIYLPQNQIAFTVVSEPAAGQKGTRGASAIYVAQEDGANAHPITFGPGNFQVETVLHDGRLLVSATDPLQAGARSDARVFYTLRPDGSGLSLFPSDAPSSMAESGGEELDDGTVLFVERQDPRGRESGGQLAWIRPGALHARAITSAKFVSWSAHALDEGRLIVAREAVNSSAGRGTFGLYAYDLSTKSFGETIYLDPKLSSVEPVPVEVGPIPLIYWSVLHPDRDYGRVVCLNAYLSGDGPQVHGRPRIARVRVVALEGDGRAKRVLGDAPVESDGSFYIKVPANLPLRFELLSRSGSVLRAQRSWIWARNGEDVGCLGCHEDKALTPEDHWPLALKRLDTPIPVGLGAQAKPEGH